MSRSRSHRALRLIAAAAALLVPAPASAATFTVSPPSIDFHFQTLATTSDPVAVTVKNKGTTVLTVAASTTGDFQATNTCPARLNPNANCIINVTFAPTALGDRSGTLTISDTASNTIAVPLRGTGVSGTIQVSPTSVTFGSVLQGANDTATVMLINDRMTPAQVSLATTNPYSANGCGSPLGPGKTCNITVRFAPGATDVGTVGSTLTITAPDAPALLVPLTGTATQRVLLSPTALDFGSAAVASTTAAQVVTVRNNQTGGLTFAATPITFTGPAATDFVRTATTCPTKLAAGATCTISVAFRPTIGGTRSATLNVNTNAFGSPHTVALTGVGTPPLTITPSSIDFGNSAVGVATAPRSVSIRNNQSIAAPIVSIVANGDFTRQAAGTTCGASIAAGASCTVALTMTPTVGGPRTGSLVITSQTSDSPNTVLLSGYGTNAVTVSVPSLTFPSQAVNTTSAPQQILLTNHQSVPSALNTQIVGDFAATNSCGGTIPALATCVVSVTFTPLATGNRSGAITFASPGSADLQVLLSGVGAQAEPPAAVATVSPGTGTLGTSVLGVVVTGNGFTHFSLSSTVSFGAGITVSNLRSASTGSLTVDLAIAPGAVPGARTVTVSTPYQNGTETASLVSGFVVSASDTRSIASVVPDTGAQGQTLTVQIVGVGTHFQQGVTIATFGNSVAVNSLIVSDPTHATANVSVSPTAELGWREVRLVTGGEFATLTPINGQGPGFNVVAGPATLASVSPATGAQGAVPFTVTLTGSATHFLQGTTQVSFGAGINVGNVQVLSPTSLTASIAVTLAAAEGPRDVTTTTGGEVARAIGGFTVTAAPPPSLVSVTPSEATQGATPTLTLIGANTHFTTDLPAPMLTLGSNIDVTDLHVVDDTTITASIAISPLAAVGTRQGQLTSGGSTFPFNFTVQASAAAVSSIAPTSGGQGRTVTVALSGFATHWQQGTTTAVFERFGCNVPVVARVTVGSPTSAVLDVQIPSNACVGPYLLRLQTGGEIVTTTLSVYAQTASLGLSPSTAMAGRTVTVNFLGEFSHFKKSQTAAVIDGAGVALQNFSVTSTASATAKFVIAPDALPGFRTVTLTSPLAGGAFEVLTAPFVVSSTPAQLTAIEPFHAAPGSTSVGARIVGLFTHFNQQTTVSFGPNTAVSNLSVVSETELHFNLAIDQGAAIGWRSAFVNTGAEQLTIGFRVDGPAAPAIVSVSPVSGAQGESLTVTITGANTNFNQSSELILGAGVSVANFAVTSPTTATAVVAVSPTAPIGPNTVIVITDTVDGQEIVSGAGFSVTAGIGQVLSVAPTAATQGQVLNVTLVGQSTHWLQGGSTADFGSGIVVTQFTVVDATHAVAQVAVLSGAPLGFRTVTVVTDGEISSLVQAFSVQQGTPTLLSSAPNAGVQGTTFDVQVLGQFTHWQQGTTTASYGAGVRVNSATVVDSVSLVLNVTIDPTAAVSSHPGCRALTVTTGTEQVSLTDQLCVAPGSAAIATVSPNAAPQGSTLTVQVTGSNTHFVQGITTASFGPGVNTSNVVVTSPTTASVDLAISTQAASGFRTATFTTLGETASLDLAFNVGPNTPTLNAATPFTGQRGQTLNVRLIGQYTHWVQGTTVTFGQGITVNHVFPVDATTVDVSISIDVLANLGGRPVTVTTGGEIVSASIFSIEAGGAAITDVAPQSGNQGQQIVLAITGEHTNWQQGFTQFSIGGAGGDIRINYVIINSQTSATAGITISPTAALGARSIYMVTGAEALVLANAVVITGGVPAIGSVTPGSARAGDTNVNVQIAGLHTRWLTGTTTVDFGPGVTVNTFTINSDTSITAVVTVHPAAGLGARTVIVRNVTQTAAQALTGYFEVVSPQPPPPFVSYLSPASGLRGQTFTITMSGLYTHWDPNPLTTRIDFGDPALSGIAINSFQVTSPTSARVNITIAPDAAFGVRTVSVSSDTDTGTEVVQAAFTVVQAVPTLAIVDPSAGMQGATLKLNVLSQYTTFDETTTFDFGPGVLVTEVRALGPTVAEVTIAIDILAPQGFRAVTATTGGVVVGGAGFFVTPSQAEIVSVTPNTARQQDTVSLDVIGVNTHWSGATTFAITGGVNVVAGTVTDATHASLVVTVAPLASLGAQSITASTAGEIASLANAFVIQPGTPLILSSTPGAAQQQANVVLTVLGQSTAWATGATSVDLGAGVTVDGVIVTSPTSLTVQAHVDPLTLLGYRNLTVTTNGQVLTLPNALLITPGPAVIAQLSPTNADQGDTVNVTVTGTNTHFMQGVTTADFGPGIAINSVQVVSATHAIVRISISATATVGLRTVVLTTPGETAARVDGFIVNQGTPLLQFVTPVSGAQGQTLTVGVIGSLTTFNGSTAFDFGPGIAVVDRTVVNGTQANVTIAISPIAARTTRDVTATTGNVTATGAALFTVTAGPAAITDVTPADVYQGQSGVSITISGTATHFTSATPSVTLGPGVTIIQVVVDSATQLRVKADISPSAPVQFNDVVVTTGGEVATLAGVFQVRAAPPVIASVSPSSAYQEQTLDVAVTGAFTHFSVGATSASFGPGIVVNSVTVVTHTQATANITIASAATPGQRTVTFNTAGEIAVGDAQFTVLEKITPAITWPTPADITYGTVLSGAQLNATTGVPGTFVYTPGAGTLLNAGAGQQLSVVFTPTNTVAYRSASASVFINVLRAPQGTLSVTGYPQSAANGTSFTVSSSGGSGAGAVTFAATGACTNSNGGALVTMTAGAGTCSIVATKQGDANYQIAISAPASVTATTPAVALGNQIVGGFDAGRAAGYGLTDGASVTTFRSDFGSLLPNARLTATTQLTDAFLSGVDVALLSSAGSSAVVTPLSQAEQDALLRFVRNGGGAVILVDNDSSSPQASAANNSFLAPFGMHVTGTHPTFTSTVTVANPAASPVTNGPFGVVSAVTLVFPGWIDVLGPATSLGTLDFNGLPSLAVIPAGALGAGSGPVVIVTDTDLENIYWTPAYRSLIFNAIAFVTAPVLADFEQGDLTGWTLTGNAWTVGGTTNTSPNIMPVSGTKFARSGAPNVLPPGVLAEANVGTATSPAFTVSGRTLTWYSTGWSGPSNDGASHFEILDASFTVRAQVQAPQSDSWVRLSVDLLNAGLLPGQTFYFRAIDAHGENNYAWLAFDRLVVRGSLARLPQALLSITNAPQTAAFGTSFTVGTSGGSGTGAVTFSASGACGNVGPQITMTSGTGTCSITAIRSGDATYEDASATVTVQATSAAPAVLDILQAAAFLAVKTDNNTNVSIPAALSVRLLAAGLSVKAPTGGVAINASSSNPACVSVGAATLPAGAFVVALPITYGGTAPLPCESTITVANPSYAGDCVTVSAASYTTGPFTSAEGSVSYFNPAPVPDPAGALQLKVASLSYYNPAPVPTPNGTYATNTAAVSYYNPAAIPAAGGGVSTNTVALSYYNPANVPTPNGTYSTNTAAVSYYNPAPIPNASSTVWASIVSVSYQNGPEQSALQSPSLAATTQQVSAGDAPSSAQAAVTAISLANGPTATRVSPVRLTRSSPAAYTITIDGANLNAARTVTFVGLEGYVTASVVAVSNDGRHITVDVFVPPATPLGVVAVIVSGPGWSTPDIPSMRVEIVQ